MPDEEMAFSLEMLIGASKQPEPVLSACDRGHLVVRGRTHYEPIRMADDLHAIWFRWVDHEEAS
jgi:hypothetical protein